MADNLCCILNATNVCWKCSAQLCIVHSCYSVEMLYWCDTCHDLDEDSFMMMAKYHERIADAAECFDEIKSELEGLADHPFRCMTCKAEQYCESLVTLADNADRLLRRKYLHKNFRYG